MDAHRARAKRGQVPSRRLRRRRAAHATLRSFGALDNGRVSQFLVSIRHRKVAVPGVRLVHIPRTMALGGPVRELEDVADKALLKLVWKKRLRKKLRTMRFADFELCHDPLENASFDWELDATTANLVAAIRSGTYRASAGKSFAERNPSGSRAHWHIYHRAICSSTLLSSKPSRINFGNGPFIGPDLVVRRWTTRTPHQRRADGSDNGFDVKGKYGR